MFDYLMDKVTYRRDLPYWVRQAIYFALLFLVGKLTIIFKKPSEECRKLKADGIVCLGNVSTMNIAPITLKESVLSCSHSEKLDDSGKLLKKIFDQQALVELQNVIDFALEEKTLNVCREFFNCEPSIAYIAAWETFAEDENDVSEMFFHMDHHGHRFLKKFCYLTDVYEGDGEHHFIKGTTERGGFNKYLKELKRTNSNLYKALMLKRQAKGQFRLCNDLIESAFQDRLLRITGTHGTTFLEDTYGLHRGTPVSKQGSRVILQVVYVPWVLKKDSSRNVRVSRDLVRNSERRRTIVSNSYSLIDQ